jgi:hypothetical protein
MPPSHRDLQTLYSNGKTVLIMERHGLMFPVQQQLTIMYRTEIQELFCTGSVLPKMAILILLTAGLHLM